MTGGCAPGACPSRTAPLLIAANAIGLRQALVQDARPPTGRADPGLRPCRLAGQAT